MKKIFLFAGAVFALMAFTACNEDFDDWANPQATPEQSAGVENVVVTVSPLFNGSQKLTYADNAGDVCVAAINAITSDDGNVENISNVKFTSFKVGNTNVPIVSGLGELYANIDDINNAVTEYYQSKRYVERQVPCEVTAVALTNEGTAINVAFANESNNFELPFLPPALPEIAYESTYYYIGGYNGWNLGAPTKMDNNGDGTFSCVLEIGDSEWFCFAPQSAVDAQNWDGLLRAQVNGDTNSSGYFNLNSASGNSFNCEKGGKYKFTISPQDWTYSYAPYSEKLYYVGDVFGWSTFFPLAKNGENFEGCYYIYKADNSSTWGFKFTTTPDWNNPQYGAGDGEGVIALDGGNCDLPSGYESGFYKIFVNTDKLTFSVQPITVISLIGSAVNGDSSWGTDYDLTLNTDKMCWEGTFDMTDGEFKFRANHDWGINWGGTADALWQDGANFSCEAGNYTFELYPMCNGMGYVNITKN